MPRIITDAELRQLRNEIDIAELIRQLGIPSKNHDGYFRFLCPICHEFNTATNPKTNLARCFRCSKNFNPIDLIVIVEHVSFLDAVTLLRSLRKEIPTSEDPQKT
jgi:DNA primase